LCDFFFEGNFFLWLISHGQSWQHILRAIYIWYILEQENKDAASKGKLTYVPSPWCRHGMRLRGPPRSIRSCMPWIVLAYLLAAPCSWTPTPLHIWCVKREREREHEHASTTSTATALWVAPARPLSSRSCCLLL
jgi:hypothetical protein